MQVILTKEEYDELVNNGIKTKLEAEDLAKALATIVANSGYYKKEHIVNAQKEIFITDTKEGKDRITGIKYEYPKYRVTVERVEEDE